MSLYKKMEQAMEKKDADAYLKLLHDEYKFVRHQSGQTMTKAAMGEMMHKMIASSAMSVGR